MKPTTISALGPPGEDLDAAGSDQHDGRVDDQHEADRQLEGVKADIGQQHHPDGDANQPGQQHRGKAAPADILPDVRQRRQLAGDGAARRELSRKQRLQHLQPERQGGQAGAKAAETVDETPSQGADQHNGQRAPILRKLPHAPPRAGFLKLRR